MFDIRHMVIGTTKCNSEYVPQSTEIMRPPSKEINTASSRHTSSSKVCSRVICKPHLIRSNDSVAILVVPTNELILQNPGIGRSDLLVESINVQPHVGTRLHIPDVLGHGHVAGRVDISRSEYLVVIIIVIVGSISSALRVPFGSRGLATTCVDETVRRVLFLDDRKWKHTSVAVEAEDVATADTTARCPIGAVVALLDAR